MNRRRHLQFGSRLMFVSIALVSAVLARLAYVENTRQAVIREIQAHGGAVEATPASRWGILQGQRVIGVTLPHGRTADLDLERLRLQSRFIDQAPP